jgi:riboflavin kinase/FMN adenylyltransferase
METTYLDHNTRLQQPCVGTIGFFDGVHRGHRFLIGCVTSAAKDAGMESVVITFDKHPRQVLQSDYVPRLLTTTEEKLRLLSATGVDRIVVLHFTPEMAAMTAFEFMNTVLHRQLNMSKLIIGYDNHFGQGGKEGFSDYCRYGSLLGIDVEAAPSFEPGGGLHVSSSQVRRFLAEGDIASANFCLGYTYTLGGTVAHGFAEGRRMGFPNANIDPQTVGQMIPATGVYAVRVMLPGHTGSLGGMLNIGSRPTFGGTDVTIEVNVFNFTGNLYEKKLRVGFLGRIRSERKFSSAEALASQLADDRQKAETIIKHTPFI